MAADLQSLGLPDGVRACLFDLDGVITRTAVVHARAWKEMFDAYLRERSEQTGELFAPFDPRADYDRYVDGKKRADGTRSFLASRGIELPEGDPDDDPGAATINGLGNRKNEIVLRRIHQDGVEVYEGSVRYLHAVRAAGVRTAVVSSSANTAEVLGVTGLTDLFDARVDGLVAREAVVFEDALAGVEAGRAGGFALVVGVDRVGQADALREHGADVVVQDLAELLGEAR
jgi:beta-phosphoglucomutase-like phosphatase (HAD superfamily)